MLHNAHEATEHTLWPTIEKTTIHWRQQTFRQMSLSDNKMKILFMTQSHKRLNELTKHSSNRFSSYLFPVFRSSFIWMFMLVGQKQHLCLFVRWQRMVEMLVFFVCLSSLSSYLIIACVHSLLVINSAAGTTFSTPQHSVGTATLCEWTNRRLDRLYGCMPARAPTWSPERPATVCKRSGNRALHFFALYEITQARWQVFTGYSSKHNFSPSRGGHNHTHIFMKY